MPAKKPNKPAPQVSLLPDGKKAPSKNTLRAWLLGAIAFTVFANTLGHDFALDDIAVIQGNQFVQMGFGGIPKLFTTFYWEGYWQSNAGLYRPLSLVMF